MRAHFADNAFIVLALIWAGLLLGVSFLATPVKFTAPGLTLPVALEVGHVTFALFSLIEWVLGALLLLSASLGSSRARLAVAALVSSIVALQALWLLPALDLRVAAVVAGAPLPPSSHHTLYAAAEAIKLVLLLGSGAWALRRA